MERYEPPFEITNRMLNCVSSISEKLGRIETRRTLERQPHLRRNNRIQSVHSSLKIEANSLSLDSVRDVLNAREVIGPAKEGGVMRCLRTQDGPKGKVGLKLTDTTSRSLAFFRPMQPLEKSRRWIMAGARTIDGVARPALSISSDDGETWHEVIVTNAVSADRILYHDKSMRWNNGCCEPTIVELSNGDLLMAVRATFRHHYIYTSFYEKPTYIFGNSEEERLLRVLSGAAQSSATNMDYPSTRCY